MIEDDEVQVFPSQLDPSLTVVIIYPGSTKYEQVLPQFQKAGHAFILHQSKMIVVDGAAVNESWFTMDHLTVIQAHEIGHYRAGHAKNAHAQGDINIEKEADWLGYKLLSDMSHSAADLHREEYQARYNSDPDEDSVELEEKLGKFIY